MKGAVFTKPLVETMQSIFDICVPPFPKEGQPSLFTVTEYHILDKVLSVPAGATAFRRAPSSNIILVSTWQNDTPENIKIARDGIWSLTDMIAKNEAKIGGANNFGYGNYSE
jgi:hypothetical protein